MTNRPYYSARTGRNTQVLRPDLALLGRLFLSVFIEFERGFYFQEAFGFYCVDSRDESGKVGSDIDAFFFRRLRKQNLWPLASNLGSYTEDDLFDVIELLHDLVSKPVEGYNHTFGACGWHYTTFDAEGGRAEFRREVNELLKDYGTGFELSPEGEVLIRGEAHLHDLLDAALPELDPANIEGRVAVAVRKFRLRHASVEDRRDALRDLVDVLEFLRPQLPAIMGSKDESDLFNIANNFGIRHHNEKQRTDYDQEIWVEALFYHYLNMIHTTIRLLAQRAVQP